MIKYHKHQAVCKKCGIKYGYDLPKDDGYCPKCWCELHKLNWRWNK
jgi:predicted Zn-ribbon and HTH transcriptional regulator